MNIDQCAIHLDKLFTFLKMFWLFQIAFCCLGTTRGKAGKEGFIKVDRDYVVSSAKILKSIGCQHFHLVTSQGSNKDSMFLYTKTKGKCWLAMHLIIN